MILHISIGSHILQEVGLIFVEFSHLNISFQNTGKCVKRYAFWRRLAWRGPKLDGGALWAMPLGRVKGHIGR